MPVVLFLFFVKKINVIVKKALQYNHACGWWFHLSFEHFMTLFLCSIRVQIMENCGCPFFFRCLYNWRQLYLWSLLLVLSLAWRGFSPGTPVSPLLKNQYFQIPIRPGIKWTVNHFVDVLPPNHYLLFISIILIWSAVFGCEEYSQGLQTKLIVDEY